MTYGSVSPGARRADEAWLRQGANARTLSGAGRVIVPAWKAGGFGLQQSLVVLPTTNGPCDKPCEGTAQDAGIAGGPEGPSASGASKVGHLRRPAAAVRASAFKASPQKGRQSVALLSFFTKHHLSPVV